MFPESDQWEFVEMPEDVTAATRTVLRTDLIDKERVTIMGETFGASLTLTGAVHSPDLYKWVVGVGGIDDWAEVMKDAKDTPRITPDR